MPRKHAECSVLDLSCNNRITLEKSMGVLCPGFMGIGHGNRRPVSPAIDNEKTRITGHTIASINELLDRYLKLTVDQAGAALAKR